MTLRHALSANMAGLLTCGLVALAPTSGAAQTPEASVWSQAPFPTEGVLTSERGGPITVVGCLQSERDYRSSNGIHRAKKPGRGDEFVLTDVVVGSGLTVPQQECTPSGAGRAIELTGVTEDHIRPRGYLPGHWVEVTGIIKRGSLREVPVGTSGEYALEPTGGSRVGHDLKLRELNVESYRLAPVAVPKAAAAPEAPPAIEPAPEPAPQAAAPPAIPEAAPTTGQEPAQLPKTASPLSLIGLIGLLSFSGALVLRATERRRVFGRR